MRRGPPGVREMATPMTMTRSMSIKPDSDLARAWELGFHAGWTCAQPEPMRYRDARFQNPYKAADAPPTHVHETQGQA